MKLAQWIKWSGLAVVLALGGLAESDTVVPESEATE